MSARALGQVAPTCVHSNTHTQAHLANSQKTLAHRKHRQRDGNVELRNSGLMPREIINPSVIGCAPAAGDRVHI